MLERVHVALLCEQVQHQRHQQARRHRQLSVREVWQEHPGEPVAGTVIHAEVETQ